MKSRVSAAYVRVGSQVIANVSLPWITAPPVWKQSPPTSGREGPPRSDVSHGSAHAALEVTGVTVVGSVFVPGTSATPAYVP